MISSPPGMRSPDQPAVVLEYGREHGSPAIWPWVLFAAGLVPFAVQVMTIIFEGAYGDPPDNLSEFKAYHYWTGAAAVIGLIWLFGTVLAFRRRHRWMLLLACAWWLWICWVGFSFLRDLHRHPAGQYYWSLW